jgi:hypothetical protein
MEIWDDSKIRTGQNWRTEIEVALRKSDAAILLVGPGFLASDFINAVELPTLLSAARRKGLRIFPLVVGYCAYHRSSLAEYQAFNDPGVPLEAQELPKQNKTLNDFSIAIDDSLRHSGSPSGTPSDAAAENLEPCMVTLKRCLDTTRKAFKAQARQRDDLVEAIRNRLKLRERLEYEKFFFRVYPELTRTERFEFDRIRALTSGPLYSANRKVLETIEQCPSLLDEIEALVDVQQHLVFWLNKYESVFVKTSEMCLLYTGVEDGVPFPKGVDQLIVKWLEERKP